MTQMGKKGQVNFFYYYYYCYYLCVNVHMNMFSLDCLQETDSVIDFIRDFAEDLFQCASSFIQVLELLLRPVNHVLCTQRTRPQETLSNHGNNS